MNDHPRYLNTVLVSCDPDGTTLTIGNEGVKTEIEHELTWDRTSELYRDMREAHLLRLGYELLNVKAEDLQDGDIFGSLGLKVGVVEHAMPARSGLDTDEDMVRVGFQAGVPGYLYLMRGLEVSVNRKIQ